MGGQEKILFQQCLLHFTMINKMKHFAKVIKKGHSPVQQKVAHHRESAMIINNCHQYIVILVNNKDFNHCVTFVVVYTVYKSYQLKIISTV